MAVSEEELMQLVGLGFTPAAVRVAFRSIGCSDATMAAGWLLDETNQAAIASADEQEERKRKRKEAEELQRLEKESRRAKLREQGYTDAVVAHALNAFDDDPTLALAWLQDAANST